MEIRKWIWRDEEAIFVNMPGNQSRIEVSVLAVDAWGNATGKVVAIFEYPELAALGDTEPIGAMLPDRAN